MHRARLLLFLMAVPLCGVAAGPPVILISVDTLRADHLSAYGYRKISTPGLDGYAQHGTVYANADAQVPLTLPSHTSMMTSTYPFANGIQENAQKVPAGATTLAGVLRANGYKTGAFIGSVFLEQEMGLDQGFDFYDSPFHYTAFSPLSGSVFFGGAVNGPNAGKDRRDAPLVTRAALQWLRQNNGQPVFAFIHLYDMHKPYRLGGYDGELAYVDQVLGSFRQTLGSMGLWEKSIVILTSDHGESLGEHDEYSHGYFAYEATLHVPLVIHWPAGINRPERVEMPVGLIDLAPTLLDVLKIAKPTSFAGTSFLQELSRVVFGETVHAQDSFGWAPVRTLRQGVWKYVESPKPELYNLAQDPGELHNTIAAQTKLATGMRNQLHQLLATNKPVATAPAVQQNRVLLNSLGYLSTGPAGTVRSGSGADLKDRLPEFRMYEDAVFALAQGRTRQAVAQLEQLLARDPGNTLARRDLGSTYLDLKQYAKARLHLEKAAHAAPADYPAQYLFGLALKNLGFSKEALTQFGVACRLAPEAQQCRRQLEELRSPR